ncbi:MAG: helix-turn-helix transcriptional regulator [Cyanobacteria bacterium J06642_2]
MQDFSETPLQQLFQAIAVSRDETELKQSVMVQLGKYFAASRWGLMFFEQLPTDRPIPKMMKLALSLDYNPVLRYLVERHVAVHDEAILAPGVWQTICPRADHWHVMVGPIISKHQLVGGVAFTRHRNAAAFNADNLADLNALCLHISVRLAALRSKVSTYNIHCDHLTQREVQIARLVAKGLTNKEIGSTLWITENSVKQALKRMYRKLEVSSRAEMVGQLTG